MRQALIKFLKTKSGPSNLYKFRSYLAENTFNLNKKGLVFAMGK